MAIDSRLKHDPAASARSARAWEEGGGASLATHPHRTAAWHRAQAEARERLAAETERAAEDCERVRLWAAALWRLRQAAEHLRQAARHRAEAERIEGGEG
jgi:hypothetical protein